jgi:hypothetical protein
LNSPSGTAKNVAASPPEAFLQSRQWQTAMNEGSVSNPSLTLPHAHWPVYLVVMASPAGLMRAEPRDETSLGRAADARGQIR